MASNVDLLVGKGPGALSTVYQAQRDVYTGSDASKRGSLDYRRTIASVVNVSVNSAEVRLSEAPFNNVELGIPATPGGSVVILGGLADGPANGKVVYYLNRISYGNSTEAFPLARPVFFEKYTTGQGSFHWRLMITDGQNVMELTKDAADPAGLARLATSGTNGPIVANEKIEPMTSYGAWKRRLHGGIREARLPKRQTILWSTRKRTLKTRRTRRRPAVWTRF